jgi:hypothetical protein
MGAERLPFQALISNDLTNAAVIAQTNRMDYNYDKDAFVRHINEMSEKEFKSFCYQIINWQHFSYQLNGTVGAESKNNIPPDQQKLFKQYIFNIKQDVELTKDDHNGEDPGIIIQKCLRSTRPREKFIGDVQLMSQEEFEEFCTDIEMLAYFVATQSGSYFSHYPELIPKGHENFWFND